MVRMHDAAMSSAVISKQAEACAGWGNMSRARM